jgi:hypothetical protein
LCLLKNDHINITIITITITTITTITITITTMIKSNTYNKKNNWIIRISNGHNFVNSSSYKVWGGTLLNKETNKINSSFSNFVNNVKDGDILWFITSNSYKYTGIIFACATFKKNVKRELGPLISITPGNDIYGWDGVEGDIEIHYTNLYDLHNINNPVIHKIRGNSSYRNYDNKSCSHLNLIDDYTNIVKYLKPVDKIK